jgi:hypothetical protein
MKILTSLVVAAALSGCAYQSGYIAPDGAWVAKDVPYAKGTCRSSAPYVMGAPGPAGLAGPMGLAGVAGPDGAAGLGGPAGPAGPAGAIGGAGLAGPVGSTGSMGAGGWSSMENVNFKYGSSDLQQKCKEKLATFATWMQNNPRARVSLDGHSSDADDRSQALAAKRVTAVKNELVRLGASPDRITVGAYGNQAPVCSQSTSACLDLNRRVEILAVGS